MYACNPVAPEQKVIGVEKLNALYVEKVSVESLDLNVTRQINERAVFGKRETVDQIRASVFFNNGKKPFGKVFRFTKSRCVSRENIK